MPDDLTTATPAHGLQLDRTKNTNRLQHDTTKQKNNTVAAQRMNFQVNTSANSATFTSHKQELTSPKYHLRERQKLFDARVTPPLLYFSGAWTMTEEMKQQLQKAQSTDDEDDRTDDGRIKITPAVVTVDEIADGEPCDLDSESEDDTTGANLQD